MPGQEPDPRCAPIHYEIAYAILCGFQMLLGFTVGALMAINGTISVGT